MEEVGPADTTLPVLLTESLNIECIKGKRKHWDWQDCYTHTIEGCHSKVSREGRKYVANKC